jgi:hypothetical protein
VEGDPAYMVFNQVKEYYPRNPPALFINLTFNFQSVAGMNHYMVQVEEAMGALSWWVSFRVVIVHILLTLLSYKSILVFLTTHSTPKTHLIWHTPEGKGALTVEDVGNLCHLAVHFYSLCNYSSSANYFQSCFSMPLERIQVLRFSSWCVVGYMMAKQSERHFQSLHHSE